MSDTAGLIFLDASADYRDAEARVARVPSGTRSQRALLSILSKELRFPAYFGHNWDALEECLRDFSWLTESRIVILHEALPLRSPAQRKVYLEVLAAAVRYWQAEGQRELLAVFPMNARRSVIAAWPPAK